MPGVILFWHFVFALVGVLIGILIGRRIERRSGSPIQRAFPAVKADVDADPAVLRAGQTPAGKIWLEMNGKHIEPRSALDPDVSQRLANLVSQLRSWLETEKTTPPAPVTAPTPPAVPPAPTPVIKEVPPVPPAMKNIIEQVNDVLQARLEASALKDRGIQLIEGSNGSVVVQDGLRRYEGLEAVPDAEITALIRASIAEWEKSAK